MLKLLTKEERNKVLSIEREGGLIDNCTHMVYLKEGWLFLGQDDSFPIADITHLKDLLQDVDTESKQ